MSILEPGLNERIEALRGRIAAACERAARCPDDVKLLAVGKTFNERALEAAADLGLRAFGENYAQEGCAKVDWFRANRPDLAEELEWHFIGPLQANKTRPVAERFDWVESVDRLRIAERLSAQRPEGLGPLNVLVEVNIDGEATKSGVKPEELPDFLEAVAAFPGLRLRGLMVIPAPADDVEAQRVPLHAARSLFGAVRSAHPEWTDFDTLSMGMSADLEAAVAEGSTEVRIGSALFGRRDYGARR